MWMKLDDPINQTLSRCLISYLSYPPDVLPLNGKNIAGVTERFQEIMWGRKNYRSQWGRWNKAASCRLF